MPPSLQIRSGAITAINGTYGPARYSGVQGAIVRPETAGNLHFKGSGEASDSNQIHLQDCDVEWHSADFENFYRAIRPQGGRSVIEDCAFTNCCQPIMVGACEGAVARRVKGTKGNDALQSPGDDHAGDFTANHMGYWSFAKKGPTLEELEAWDFNGCGVHLNGKDGSDGTPKSPQFGTAINGMKLVRCGSGGTHAFQPDNNQDCTVNRYLCVDPEVGPLAMWHNGMGPDYACKRWKLTNGTLWCRDAKTNVHIGEGTEDITFDQYIFVLANDLMFADAENGGNPPYVPVVTNSYVFCWDEAHVPDSVKADRSNIIKPVAEVGAFLKDTGDKDLVPVDPAVTAGWRPAAATPDSPQPTPSPDPVPPDPEPVLPPEPAPAPPEPLDPSPTVSIDRLQLGSAVKDLNLEMRALRNAIAGIHNPHVRETAVLALTAVQEKVKKITDLASS